MKSNFLFALLIGASVVTFSADELLKSNNYFDFIEYRHVLLFLIFTISFLSIRRFNTKKHNNDKELNKINRWKLENMSRYEYISILVIIIYLFPLPFLTEHILQAQIVKGILCLYILIWLSKKSHNKSINKNN